MRVELDHRFCCTPGHVNKWSWIHDYLKLTSLVPVPNNRLLVHSVYGANFLLSPYCDVA